MSELVLFIGDHSHAYDNGDIIHAFNRRRIRQVHAEHIAHPWKTGLNANGVRVQGSLADMMLEKTHQFKFQRVSQTEVMRIDLTNDETELLGPTPNENGEAMNVPMFVAARKAERAADGGPMFAIFGDEGAEYWYGGNIDTSEEKIESVWDEIEHRTGKLRTNHDKWPFSETELAHFLALPVEDFDDAVANDLESPLYDPLVEEPSILKKRKNRVAWQELFPVNLPPTTRKADVEDMRKPVDIRGKAPFKRADIVIPK